ncbi:hypothetical protein [Candidatus Albibeggiatoa sp. nov. BB20]|uniref:leucine-rich repeat domain-containing protein n=1 Tax=Candidatus Albibeggiatoa sp. nov. BB20 TaxID=3162723 RepID=UPI0033652F41
MPELAAEINALPRSTRSLSLRYRKLKWGIWENKAARAIEAMQDLEQIDFSHNQIDYVPFDWTKLLRLKHINLANNDLGYWYYERPTKLGYNWHLCETLESLSVRSNHMTWFGVPEHNWQSLRCLDVSNNVGREFMYNVMPDKAFSFTLKLPYIASLRELRISHNNYKVFPQVLHFDNLETLDLRYNKLSEFPKNIGRLARLQRLNLASNRLQSLPAWLFTELPALREVDVRNNARLSTKHLLTLQEHYPDTRILWQS